MSHLTTSESFGASEKIGTEAAWLARRGQPVGLRYRKPRSASTRIGKRRRTGYLWAAAAVIVALAVASASVLAVSGGSLQAQPQEASGAQAQGAASNPPVATVSASAATVAENATTNPSFTISVTSLPTGSNVMKVSFMVEPGAADAASPEDYTLTDPDDNEISGWGSVTFTASDTSTSKNITLDPENDTLGEPSETVTLKLASCRSSNCSLGDSASATITITDDADLPELKVKRMGSPLVAQSGQTKFKVTLSKAPSSQLSVPLRKGYNSTAASSYYELHDEANTQLYLDGNLIFNSGQTEKTITLTGSSNIADRSAQTLMLDFYKDRRSGYTVTPENGRELVWLRQSDTGLEVATFRKGRLAMSEGGSGAYSVYLLGGQTRTIPVEVSYAIDHVPGTAHDIPHSDHAMGPLDFTLVPSRSVTFEPGVYEKTVNFTARDDDVNEHTEIAEFVLHDSTADDDDNDHYSLVAGAASANFRITDNDPLPVASISRASGSGAIAEGEHADLNISLSAASDKNPIVSYRLATTGSTAKSSDYTLSMDGVTIPQTGTLEFGAEETQKTIRFTAVADGEYESTAETARIELFIGTRHSGTFTLSTADGYEDIGIAADTVDPEELPVASLSAAAGTDVTEGDSKVFTVTLSKDPTETFKVHFELDVVDTDVATSDFSLSPDQKWVQFTSGGSRTAMFTLTATDDALSEPVSEKLTIRLVPDSDGIENYNISASDSDAVASISLIDNNDPLPKVSVDVYDQITEGSEVNYWVSLSEASGSPLTVKFQPAFHYASFTMPTREIKSLDPFNELLFTPGEIVKPIKLSAIDDFSGQLGGSFLIRILGGLGYSRYSNGQSRTGAIITDSDYVPKVSIESPGSVAEGSSGDFTISLSEAPPQGSSLTVSYAAVWTGKRPGDTLVPNGPTSQSGQVIFASGVSEQTITLTPASFNTGNGGNLYGSVDVRLSNTGKYTISPNKERATAWFHSADASGKVFIEHGGSLHFLPNHISEGNSKSFRVTYIGPALTEPLNVDYSVATTASNSDYSLSSGPEVITISAGETSTVLTLLAQDDDIVEPDELITINLEAGSGYVVGSQASASILIVDPDPLPIASIVRLGPESIDEGGARSFAILLDRPSQREVKITYGQNTAFSPPSGMTAAGPADISWRSEEAVRFAPGDSYKVIHLPVVVDSLDEADESIQIKLNDGTGYSVDSETGSALVTIVDQNPPMASIRRVSTKAKTESTDREFEISLSAPPDRYVTVGFEVASFVTNAEAGDYTLPNPALVTFAPGEMAAKRFTVSITDDDLSEFSELLELRLKEGDHYAIDLAQASAVIQIDDNDSDGDSNLTASVALANSSVSSVAEGGTLDFTISLSEKAGRPTKVYYGIDSTSTATLTDDFTLDPAGYVIIPEGSASENITLTAGVGADGLDEDSESVTLYLFDTPGINLSDSGASVMAAITDAAGDSPPVASIAWQESSLATIAEGELFRFKVSLSEASGYPLDVGFALGTATSPATTVDDFALTLFPSGKALEPPWTVRFEPGETEKFVVLTAETDGSHEPTENLVLDLDTAVGATDHYTRHATNNSLTATVTSSDPVPELSVTFDGMPEGTSVASINEQGLTSVTLNFTLSHSSGYPISVEVQPRSGTGVTPDDYSLSRSTVDFAANASGDDLTQKVTVTAGYDTLHEGTEVMRIRFRNNASRFTPKQGKSSVTVNIMDNDEAPFAKLSFKDELDTLRMKDLTEGRSLKLKVELETASGLPATVRLDASAVQADEDDLDDSEFTLSPDMVTIEAGQTTTATEVFLTANRDDEDGESPESLTVIVDEPIGDNYRQPTDGSGTVTVTIIEQLIPEVSISLDNGTSIYEDDDQELEFTIRLDRDAPAGGLEVTYELDSSANNAATASGTGQDYTLVPAVDSVTSRGTVMIPAGQSDIAITLTTAEDSFNDGGETVTLRLPTGDGSTYTVDSEASVAVATIRDNSPPVVNASYSDDDDAFRIRVSPRVNHEVKVRFALHDTTTSITNPISLTAGDGVIEEMNRSVLIRLSDYNITPTANIRFTLTACRENTCRLGTPTVVYADPSG